MMVETLISGSGGFDYFILLYVFSRHIGIVSLPPVASPSQPV